MPTVNGEIPCQFAGISRHFAVFGVRGSPSVSASAVVGGLGPREVGEGVGAIASPVREWSVERCLT